MDECTINSLLTLNTVEQEGVKVIIIPLEDVLRGKISIRINKPAVDLKPAAPIEVKKEAPSDTFTIPIEIQRLYPDKNKLAQDVVDYLKVIADCWALHNVGLKTSVLKKAAAAKPALNSVIYNVYGKDGDTYLTQLVNDNKFFIEKCWTEK